MLASHRKSLEPANPAVMIGGWPTAGPGGPMKIRGICYVFAIALFAALAVLPKSADAQDLLSGHIGVATPIVTYTGSNGTSNTTTIGNSFDILFPFGIGVRPQFSPVIFDFEFDPVVHPSTRSDALVVQPGVILPLQDGWVLEFGPHSRSIRTLLVLHRS